MIKLMLLTAFTLANAHYPEYDDPFGDDLLVTGPYYQPPVVVRNNRPQRVPCHLHGKDRLGGHPVPHHVKCKAGHHQVIPFCGKCKHHEGTEISENFPTTTPSPQEIEPVVDAGKSIDDFSEGEPIAERNGGNATAEISPTDLHPGEPVPRSDDSATSTTKSAAYMMAGRTVAASLTFILGFL
jgi:hypothetical protein